MDYTGKIISKTSGQPTQASASGVWTLDEAAAAVKNNSWPIPGVPNPISKSLRFNSADSAYLNRTPGVAGNRRTWTWSGWFKKTKNVDDYPPLFNAGQSAPDVVLRFDGGGTYPDTLNAILENGGGGNSLLSTTQVFRDPSAWYHIVWAVDTTQATANNRQRLYINGVEVTNFNTRTNPSQNFDTQVNNTVEHRIGAQRYASYYNGYMTEVNFIDGQQLTPSSFGQTNANTGVWEPKPYTGTYGGNGFYLNFKDSATTTALGYDYSGNGNNWTPNNFSVTAGAGNDSLVDVPTQWIGYNTSGDTGGIWRGNYATWNPIYVIPNNTANTFVNGNLQFAPTQAEGTGESSAVATMPLPTTGKWYWEVTPTAVATSATRTQIGIMAQSTISYAMGLIGSGNFAYTANGGAFSKVNNNIGGSYGDSYAANDVIGVAVDLDNGAIYFAKNGTWQNSGVPTSGSSKTGAAYTTLTGSSNYFPAVGYWGTFVANFGQRPFAYTPPAGFLSLCTTNLPTPTIGATSTTQAGKYFNTVLYTGNGTTQTISGVGFQPDLVWCKSRSNAYWHSLVDAVRSRAYTIFSNTTNAEFTSASDKELTAFTSDGFSLGPDFNYSINSSGATFVAWNWKANGAGSTNNAGTITSTVSANTTAGFSIVTYTGNGTSGATVGHGCLVNGAATTPSMVILKRRDAVSNWQVKHVSLNANQNLELNSTATVDTAPGSGYISAISSTTLTLLNGGSAITNVNANTGTYVVYCFAPVAGYSAFGSYTGNGSSDGPFIYLGFRPRYLMIKSTSVATSWYVTDAARSTANETKLSLFPESSGAEINEANGTDYLSNGFKIRAGTGLGLNNSSATYIYAAFAESPFKYALAR